MLQSKHSRSAYYRVVERIGPQHDSVYVVEAVFDDEVLGVGQGKNKKEAEQAAAAQAVDKLTSKE